MQIIQNTVVTLRQRVTDPDGRLVDDGTAPIQYLHGGYGGIFAKLEAALDGKSIGDSVQVTLGPKDAFGPYDPALVITAPPSSFAEPPVVGEMVERDIKGVPLTYRITAVDGGQVKLDANPPHAGMTLTFSATVMELRPATPDEVTAEIHNLTQAVAKGKMVESALAHAKDEAAAEKEEAELARAEAADLVETVSVKKFGYRIRFIFRSQTHKLCWLAPLFLLPSLGIWLGVEGHEVAGGIFGGLWLAWTFFFPALIRMAIDRWGFRFLFFDFSPNPSPSRVENAIVIGSQFASFLGALIYLVVALFHLEHASDLWGTLGATVAVLFILVLVLTILLPFLVIVLTAFRIRPVIDKVSTTG